jgi:DNA-binding MarR family transcriptional regulator
MKIDEAIKSRFSGSFQKAMVNLFYTSKFFEEKLDSIFRPFGIRMQHYNVLRIIQGKHPEKVNPGYIKSVMIDKRRDLTRLADKLVKQGLIHREQCPDNRRKVELSLTGEGGKLMAKLEVLMKDFYEDFRKLPEEDYERLSHYLDEMRNNL